MELRKSKFSYGISSAPSKPVYKSVTFIYQLHFLSQMVAISIAEREQEDLSVLVKGFCQGLTTILLDLVAPQRPSRMLPFYEQQRQWMKAGDCAAELGRYDRAWHNYELEGTPAAYLEASLLAEQRQDYQKALDYALKANDQIRAGFYRARLGDYHGALDGWKRMARGEV